ncbi:MAG TPA: glycosyltransferase [Gammaproteobacteria bacterium]|nr:glycosyltransferase [Gammaproteobacteria bacterium]
MNSLPRILYVLHDNIKNAGGTEHHTMTLLSGLDNCYDTWVVYPDGNKLCVSNDGEECMTGPAEPFSPLIPPYCSTVIDQSFGKLLLNLRPDIIHIQHFLRWPLNIIDLAIQSKIPTVLSIHDYYVITPEYILHKDRDPCEPLTPDNSIKRYGEDISVYLNKRRDILASSMRRVSRLVVPSEFVRQTLNKVFPNECTVIPHGIPPSPRRPKRSNSEKLAFGCAGNLVPSKGWEQLLEAFLSLRKQHPNTELHFFGEIQSEYKLQQVNNPASRYFGEHTPGVIYHGGYDASSIYDLFSLVDVLVIPSLTAETYSLVLSEAWMAGLPVAVSDIGALGARVVDGINGKKFVAGNIGSIKETLTWFVENDSWKSWEIKKPRTSAEMLEDYDQLYKELL